MNLGFTILLLPLLASALTLLVSRRNGIQEKKVQNRI